VRVLIADEDPGRWHRLRATLEAVDGIDVVSDAAGGTDVVGAATALAPDVVVMNPHTPPGGGQLAAITKIRSTLPGVDVLVVTAEQDDDLIFAAIHAGARGYLLTDSTPTIVVAAVRTVALGDAVFGPGIADRVIGMLIASFGSGRTPLATLTSPRPSRRRPCTAEPSRGSSTQ
jgi:DNA-binding NarL/FixJ family response regulator